MPICSLSFRFAFCARTKAFLFLIVPRLEKNFHFPFSRIQKGIFPLFVFSPPEALFYSYSFFIHRQTSRDAASGSSRLT
jgi:hypothetical protein